MSTHEGKVMPSIVLMLEYYASIKISLCYIEKDRKNIEFTV